MGNEQQKIEDLGLNEFDLYRSMGASAINLTTQIISLYFEANALKNKSDGLKNMTFFQYMFISMEGRFSFSTKLLSIESGAHCVDLSNVEFRSDPYILSNFFQATSNAHKAMTKKQSKQKAMYQQKIIISPQTIAGFESSQILRLTKHCRQNNVQLCIKCDWIKWYKSQHSFDYCLDVQHFKVEPYHTALTYAISKDGYDGIDYFNRLLLAGVDVNKPNKETDSPLLLSCMLKKLEYTKLLLKNGARINEVNSSNKTALFHACARRELDLIQVLLDYNVDVFIQDTEFGNTVLLESAFTMQQMVKLIINHSNVQKQAQLKKKNLCNIPNFKGETILFKAANFGLLETVRVLIENGDANIDYKDGDGLTALFKARTAPIIEFLIENGASLTITNNKQQTPIFGCIHMRLYTLLLIFKKYYTDKSEMNHQDIDGNTVFHYLAKRQEWQYLASLIQHSDFDFIDIELKNNEKQSIQDMLIEAKQNGHDQAIKYFDSITTINNTKETDL